jgi:YfiR/HmsC-like
MTHRRKFVLATCLSGWFILTAATPGGAATETEIKAAMLFNFTKFIEWSGPKGDAKTPIVVGVAGDAATQEALEGLVRERAGGRPVMLRHVEQPADVELCHLLYLGKGVKKRLPDFLAAPRRGVVTVGDGESFAKAGGTIGFIVVDNKLRFEVNLPAANAAGVTISSRLLRLATGVRQ